MMKGIASTFAVGMIEFLHVRLIKYCGALVVVVLSKKSIFLNN